MYKAPTIHTGKAGFHYTTHRDVTVAALTHAFEVAEERIKKEAEESGNMIDPNSLIVEVVIAGRAL